MSFGPLGWHPGPLGQGPGACAGIDLAGYACSAVGHPEQGPAQQAQAAAGSAAGAVGHHIATGIGDGIARFAADGAATAFVWLQAAMGPALAPNYRITLPFYDQMLAIGYLLITFFLALALIDHMLGGARGAGPARVLGRVVMAMVIATTGIVVVSRTTSYVDDLSSIWSGDTFVAGHQAMQHVAGLFQNPDGSESLLGAAQLAVTGLLAGLALLLLVAELLARALILDMLVVLIPLCAVAAIWPRTSGALRKVTDGLVALALSKFFILAMIALGFQMLAAGFSGITGEWPALIAGIALLFLAAAVPGMLFAGVNFGHHQIDSAASRWSRAGRPVAAAASAVTAGGRSVLVGSPAYFGHRLRGDAEGSLITAPTGRERHPPATSPLRMPDVSRDRPRSSTSSPSQSLIGVRGTGPEASG